MTDSENTTQPLIGASSHSAVDVGTMEERPRPSRAYKIAGFTLLGCVLIVGQAAIAYFLLSQNSDIKSLEDENNKIKTQLSNGRSAAIPARMHMSMNAFSDVLSDTMETVKPAFVSLKRRTFLLMPLNYVPLTACQMEAAGLMPVRVPGFRPTCDSRGLYTPEQCYKTECWCVNPISGQQVPKPQGSNHCSTPVLADKMMPLALMDVEN
ncbi:HLA class II histocompatibility antigen gamma chain [Oryzias melastigma]|uniref:HLA class II histocompatibility antigen gamma chain n=1 Tax=Oryzias melastigma TaxID=30732 RepID=A0A834C2B0_ORYME|nr:HLA class II histocompatibility antigen gamma chain [Oryzias melastigma]